MKAFRLLLIISLLAGFASCGGQAERDRKALEERYQKFYASQEGHEKDNARELDAAMAEYIKEHPDDTAGVPQLLWKRSKLNMATLGNYETAMPLLQEIYTKYPKHPRAPQALQLEAFTYDETLQDKAKAREKYQELIRRYPEHPFAKEAAVLLELLDKDLSEYTKQFLPDSVKKEAKKNHLP